MSKKLTKPQLIKVLEEKYGYDKKDLKDEKGNVLTNAKLESLINKEEEDAKNLKIEETIITAKEIEIKDDDLIVIMNGLSGALTHRSSSTGRVWRFTEFGQTAKIPYSEILTIRNLNPKVFTDGWMVILNRQLQEEFDLIDIYKNILTPDNIESIFEKEIDEVKEFVDELPEGMKVTFVNKARELYLNNKIDSRQLIDYIENKFNISLDDNAPLSDEVY